MKLSKDGISLIKRFEGCKLKAYLCSAGVPTIGWGNTYYPDGSKVQMGDIITQDKANELFMLMVKEYVDTVNALVKSNINENQHSALVSLCYNIGPSNFQKSSVLKLVNINPNDTSISDAFKLWNKAKGQIITGLVNRRNAEITLFFTPITKQ